MYLSEVRQSLCMPLSVSNYLVGERRDESLRFILIGIAIAVAVLLLDSLVTMVDFSGSPLSYFFFLGVAIAASVNSFRNNGVLISVFLAWVITAGAVVSGSFAGFHSDPTVWERYIIGPTVLGFAFGAPFGLAGFLIGRGFRKLLN